MTVMTETYLRKINDLVAVHAMGWRRTTHPVLGECWANESGHYMADAALFRPSERIDWAWDVVKKMAADGWLPSIGYGYGCWECCMGHAAFDGGYATAEHAPLAICLATLVALDVSESEAQLKQMAKKLSATTVFDVHDARQALVATGTEEMARDLLDVAAASNRSVGEEIAGNAKMRR